MKLLFVLTALLMPVAIAQGASYDNKSRGEIIHVGSRDGSVATDGYGGCEGNDCPRICDVLLFDGAGGAPGGACTMVLDGCVRLDASLPSCGSTNMQQLQAALDAGGRAWRNEYPQGSTYANATVNSIPLGGAEANAIMQSFGNDVYSEKSYAHEAATWSYLAGASERLWELAGGLTPPEIAPALPVPGDIALTPSRISMFGGSIADSLNAVPDQTPDQVSTVSGFGQTPAPQQPLYLRVWERMTYENFNRMTDSIQHFFRCRASHC